MGQPILQDSEHYSELVARQVDQYKETEVMHDLPPIFDYWSGKYNSPKSDIIIEANSLTAFYANTFQKCLEQSNSNFLISIGSGDSSIEIDIVKELMNRNVKNFFFICLELSPVLIEKARKKIDLEKLGDVITAAQIDINSWKPNYTFAGVMAHHALHHILDLEQLFAIIKTNLAPKGRFLSADMIGRNGHMRWPEALLFIRKIWEKLPLKYKFNHQFKKYDYYFDNWDCSTEGFEGIRAQDILPLLTKNFSFEAFFAYGNIIDVFIDRGFGPNFDPANPLDRQFIDYVESTNEQLISDGIIKPTTMLAVMSNEAFQDTKMYKHWSPQFCVRDCLKAAPVYNIAPFIKDVYEVGNNTDNSAKPSYTLGNELKFASGVATMDHHLMGKSYLTYGWTSPDDNCTWSCCEDAALRLPLKNATVKNFVLTLKMLVYHSPLYATTNVEILINGITASLLTYENKSDAFSSDVTVQVPFSIAANETAIDVRLIAPNRRQPQYEGGSDLRALGVGISSLKVVEA